MELEHHFHWLTTTLAVGDEYSATPPACWQHFSAILNLTEEKHEGMSLEYNNYLWVPFSDGDGRAFKRKLPLAMRFLKKNEDTKTLVHCTAGASRSVAVALAYMCKRQSITTTLEMENILKEIQASRPCAYPAQVFLDVIAQRFDIKPPQMGW